MNIINKKIILFLTLLISIAGYSFNKSFAVILFDDWSQETINESTPKDEKEAIKKFNEDIKMNFYYHDEYYTDFFTEKSSYTNKSLNFKELLKRLGQKNSLATFLDGIYVTYGEPFSTADKRARPSLRTYDGINPPHKIEDQFLGYDIKGAFFDNPSYPWKNYYGYALKEYTFFIRPWEFSGLAQKYSLTQGVSDFNKMAFANIDIRKKLLDLIKKGIYFKYVKYSAEETVINPGADNRFGKFSMFYGKDIYSSSELDYEHMKDPNNIERPTKLLFTKNNTLGYINNNNNQYDWLDCVYVLSPPTTFSWGTGYVFYYSGIFGNNSIDESKVDYFTIPIAPFMFDRDYSATILRTGTEKGIRNESNFIQTDMTASDRQQSGIYEAIIEINGENLSSTQKESPSINISIENAYIVEINGVENKEDINSFSGDSTLTLSTLSKWKDMVRGNLENDSIEELTEYTDIEWMNESNNLSVKNRKKSYRLEKKRFFKVNLQHSPSQVLFTVDPLNKKAKRYYKVKWKQNGKGSDIKITVSVNLLTSENGNMTIIPESITYNNFDEAKIKMPLPDLSCAFIRTGTEEDGGIAQLGKNYTAVLEVRTTDLNFQSLKSKIFAKIGENVVVEEMIEFDSNKFKNIYRDRNNDSIKVRNIVSRIRDIDWVFNNDENQTMGAFKFNTDYSFEDRLKEFTYKEISSHGKVSYISYDENPGVLRRYYLIDWKIDYPTKVDFLAQVNYNKYGEPEMGEDRYDNNTDYIFVKTTHFNDTAKYILDYDDYEKEMAYYINNGKRLSSQIFLPKSDATTKYSWGGHKTEGTLNIKILDKNDIIGFPQKFNSGALTSIENNLTTVNRYPYFNWVTKRSSLGEDVINKNYLDNFYSPKDYFGVNTFGSYIRRLYDIYILTAHSNSAGSVSYSFDYSGTNAATDDFKPEENVAPNGIEIMAKNYNGKVLKLQSFYQGEIETKDQRKKRLEWEGTRYNIPVQRVMKSTNLAGGVDKLIAVDGKYDRTFQHIDTAEVRYLVVDSIRNHFQLDREASYDNPGNRFKWKYNFAPFATDVDLQNLPYPLKSGYFFIPYGKYSAVVRTVIYKNANDKTEHQGIVNSVVNSFEVKNDMPLIDINGNTISYIPINVVKDYKKISDENLSYDNAPIYDINKYLYSNESELLANTNQLYRLILEGFSFGNDEVGRKSWDLYRYREYVKSSSIRRVEEETKITFYLNPEFKNKQGRYYSKLNTKNGDYPIKILFNEFHNSREDNLARTGAKVDMESITINIRGSMLDDPFEQEN